MLREGLFDHHRRDYLSLTVAGATPLGQAALGPVPEGYAWYIEAIGFLVLGDSHTAVVVVAVTPDNGALPAPAAWDGQGLLWAFSTAAKKGSENDGSDLYVGPGSYIRALASQGTLAAGDIVTVNFQIAVHQLNPRAFMSRQDQEQVRAAHERAPEHLFAESAVAARRAV